MALVAWTTRSATIAGNKRYVFGTAALASGTNHIQTGLRVIISSNVTPVQDTTGPPAVGQNVLTKHNTAEGTEDDAKESGYLTIEGAEALTYNIMAWGW